jgi:hypothetical protein
MARRTRRAPSPAQSRALDGKRKLAGAALDAGAARGGPAGGASVRSPADASDRLAATPADYWAAGAFQFAPSRASVSR